MATTYFSHVDATGKTLSVTVQRLVDGATDQYFDPSDSTFKTGLVYSGKKIPLVAGTSENAGTYDVGIVGLSGVGNNVDPGLCRFRVHDEGAANKTIRIVEGVILGGKLVQLDQFPSVLATLSGLSSAVSSVLTSMPVPELAGAPGRTPTVAEILQLLYIFNRYKTESTSERLRVFDADNRPVLDATLVPTEATFTREAVRAAV